MNAPRPNQRALQAMAAAARRARQGAPSAPDDPRPVDPKPVEQTPEATVQLEPNAIAGPGDDSAHGKTPSRPRGTQRRLRSETVLRRSVIVAAALVAAASIAVIVGRLTGTTSATPPPASVPASRTPTQPTTTPTAAPPTTTSPIGVSPIGASPITTAPAVTPPGSASTKPTTSPTTPTSPPSTSAPVPALPSTTVPPGVVASGAPVLRTLDPSSGTAGQVVTISGTNLFSANGQVQATFDGQQAPTSCPTETSCSVIVPALPGGPHTVVVTVSTESGTSNALTFSYGGSLPSGLNGADLATGG